VELVDLCIDDVDGGFDGCGSFALQVGIERGIDAQAFAVEVALAELLQQLIVHQIDEVGRLVCVHTH